MRRTLLPLLLMVLPLLPGCGDDAPRPNVLIIALDTLRADRMSLYGYDRPTTPELEAFAATAMTFDRAITPCSWTRTAFASYFTGLNPGAHGTEDRSSQLAEHHLTLAERFKDKGWRTAAFYANGNIAADFGFDQGFDLYDSPPLNAGYPGGQRMIDAASMTGRAVEWLRAERPAEDPWFLFLLYIDPHDPYLPHPEHEFGTERATTSLNGRRLLLRELDKGDKTTDVDKLQRIIRNLYDGEVAYLDRHVGLLLDELTAQGLDEDTVVIVLADHGEGLWDHGYRAHGRQIYQEQIHSPLVVRWPGRTEPGAREPRPVPVLDVFGTLADAFDLADPDEHQAGDIFAPRPHPITVQEILEDVDLRAVIDWPWKLILDHGKPAELYHLDDDPAERRSLLQDHPDLVARLVAVDDSVRVADAARRIADVGRDPRIRLDPKTEQQLRALGYID